MVCFRDILPFPGSQQLVILDDKSQAIEQGTCLTVRTLIAGRYVKLWPQLANSLYLKEWSQEISLSKTSKAWILSVAHHQHSNELIHDQKSNVLSRYRHKLDAAQIYDSVYASLFTYDCNSEVRKAFFEACFEELTGVDKTNNRFIPHYCKYLFYTYHLLRKSAVGGQFSNVSLKMWILFWSKKDMKYRQPPSRKEKKKTRPKSTHNPSGDFDVHQEWTTAEETPFSKLGLDRKLRDETYLAAYLACWLCTFVLSIDDVGSIRPTTFKIARMMATGRKVSLGIPVLASIYKGLNKVSNSSRPTHVGYSFPVHFIYAWLACYFKTHYSVPQDIRGPKIMQFSGEAKELEQDYFIVICSNYLLLRQGEHFVVEPYSPYRFSHQFGYYQEVPGVLGRDFRQANLEDGLPYWRLYTLSKSMSKACLISTKPTVRAENDDQNGGVNLPMDKDHDVQILEKEILGIDDDEKSQDSQKSSTRLNLYTPVAMKVNKEVVDSPKIKEPPQCVDVSIFEGEKLVLSNQKKFLQMLWDDLCWKISNTPIDSISSIHDEVQVVLTSMLFDQAAAYDNARSSSLSKASKELLARRMKEAKDRFREVRIKESKPEQELNNLEEHKRNLIALLDQQQQILQSVQAKVRKIEEEITAIKNTSSLSDEAAENLNTAMK
ncbi:hypothetical protein CDL12_05726 [Handroanthus impetiginosus]|uniref:Aminotransferase-like plant mobile domain-containing protein n=1 Tax=Handroanthus impetiginosus TaxID=429701 RepID=A0A2G9HVP2_9LAMI|nr:hypothetical protein CDL12_05726 [Handroanthus impetiginosus]